MRKNGRIYTDNMKLAAYLMSKKVRFLRIENSGIKKGIKVFVFEADDRAKIEKAKFLNRAARVEPNLYIERYRDLRSLIRAEKVAKEVIKEAEELYDAHRSRACL